MRTINFLGFLFIIVLLFVLYNASEKGPYIFKNSNSHKIKINRDTFEPNELTIRPGDEVTWRSHDYVLRHTVVNDDPFLRNSEVLLKGDEFKIIFDRPGDYVFYSSLYPQFQKGIVHVKELERGTKYRQRVKSNVLDVVFKVQRVFMKSFKQFYQIMKKLIKENVGFKVYATLGLIAVLTFFYVFNVQFVFNFNFSMVAGFVLIMGYYYYRNNKVGDITSKIKPLDNLTTQFKKLIPIANATTQLQNIIPTIDDKNKIDTKK